MQTLTKVTVATPVLQDLVARAFKGSTLVDLIPASCLMQVKIKDNVLSVRTTDNVNYVTTFANVQADDFEVVVESKLFSSLVSKLSTATTSLSVEDNKVIVEANGKYNIPLAVDADGSKIDLKEPEFTPNGSCKHVEAEEIRSILSLNKSCKADMKEIPALYNYYMDENQVLTTNVFKACINPVKVSDRPIALTPALMELVPVVMDEGGVDVEQDEQYIKFSSQKGTLIGKKATGADIDKFPAADLIALFNQAVAHKAKLNRTLLINAVDRIGLFVDAFQQNKLILTFSKDSVSLYSESTDSREAVKYIEALTDDFEPVSIVVDALYLKNELTACSKEDITIKFSDEIGLLIECDTVTLALGTLDDEEE